MAERLLVVAGARALSCTSPARLWAVRTIAEHLDGVAIVAHGDCAHSPDEWADALAVLAQLTVVRFSLARLPTLATCVRGVWHHRSARVAEVAAYRTPLERNAVMATWAGTMLARGYDVRALTLRASWSRTTGRATEGTAHARDRLVAALGEGRVVDLVCDRALGPVEAK